MKVSRKILASRVLVLAGATLSGFYPEAGAILTAAPGLVDALGADEVTSVPTATAAFTRSERLDAYLDYERNVLSAFAEASFIASLQASRLPNIWYLAPLWRATRRLQAASASALPALATVHLVAPGSVFDTARAAAEELGTALTALGSQKLGSPSAREAAAVAGRRLGMAINSFRDAVVADLASLPE